MIVFVSGTRWWSFFNMNNPHPDDDHVSHFLNLIIFILKQKNRVNLYFSLIFFSNFRRTQLLPDLKYQYRRFQVTTMCIPQPKTRQETHQLYRRIFNTLC